MVREVEVLWQPGSLEVEELGVSSRHINGHVLLGDGLGHEHVVLCHHDAVACVQDSVHCLEEIIRLVQVHALLPSLSCLLVALEVGVVSDEDPGLRLFFAYFTETKRQAG